MKNFQDMKIINMVFSLIEGILSAIIGGTFDALNSLISHERKTEYNSDFLAPNKLLSRGNTGFNLTGILALPAVSSFSNCSLFGPSGSGKSSVVILPSIFSLAKGGATICCNDPSGELHEKVSGWLAKIGYTILCLDFSQPDRSEGFNPLARCKTISDIQKVAHLIIRNTIGGDSKGDPFWDRSAEMLIVLFARYLVFHAAPEYRTMTNVLRIIETFATHPKKLDALFVAANDDELLGQYKATIVYGDKTLQSIIATTRAALNLFSDPTIIRTTSVDTIDFSRFRSDKVALFICNPIKDLHYYKPLSALFFESLFNEIMSRIPKPKERPIFCILEEAATMKFSSLGIVVSNIRKYIAGIMIVVQDYQALVSLYGPAEAHNLRTNTFAQVYLKGQPHETCKELESILGRFSYTDTKGSEKIRLLMSADEIRRSEAAIILCGNHAPIKARMTPYYRQYTLRKRSELPPYQPQTKLPSALPPLIPC